MDNLVEMTQEQIEEMIVRRYVAGESLGHLAKACGVCKRTILLLLRRHGVVVRYHQQYIPTPDEIEEAAKEIRDSWDEDTRLARSAVRTLPVSVPLCKDPHGGRVFHNTRAI